MSAVMERSLEQLVDQALASRPDGCKAGAAKRGRNPRFPYVPIVNHGDRTEQIRQHAYRTRPEAVAFAALVIEHRRQVLRDMLIDARMRALRESYGLPRDIG